jgi:transposase-like protein
MANTTVDAMGDVGKIIEESQARQLLSLLTAALTMVMDHEVTGLCGAETGERTPERQNRRNGYRERAFETRLGTVDLQIPKVRQGSYFPSFLEPRRRWEQAFVNVVSEAYILGVSTRKVEELMNALGAKGMSKSEVSRVAGELDAYVTEFRQRKFSTPFPYLWIDAIYVKSREGSRTVSKAVLVAYGVSEEGTREVLGVEVADSEMEDSWCHFLEGLVQRGLRGVQLAISDAHTGIKKALRKVFNGVTWQRCRVHFMRNVLARVPRAAQGLVSLALRQVFMQPSYKEAREAMTRAIELLDAKYPAAAAIVRDAEDDVLSYMQFPEKHWRQIHSTNPLERLNREIRRRSDVIGIFPNSGAVLRLIAMLLIEQNEEWSVGRRYFSLESMAPLKASRPEAIALEKAA